MTKEHIKPMFNATQLDAAFKVLSQQRQHFPLSDELWRCWRDWPQWKTDLLDTINRGDYLFSPLRRIRKKNGQVQHLWTSSDALAIKVVTEELQQRLTLSPRCSHLKNHGGLKQTIRTVQSNLKDYRFVCKTDVKGFYESIDQYTLLNLIADQVPDSLLRNYCYQIIRRTVEDGGEYWEVEQGISRGSAISPLFGALYLKELDDRMSHQQGICYMHYMDDILILTQTHWQL